MVSRRQAQIGGLLTLLATLMVIALFGRVSQESFEKPGFTHETFLAVRATVSKSRKDVEIRRPMLGLSEEQYAQWVRGKLFVEDRPENGAGLNRDLNEDGFSDRVLPVETDRGPMFAMVYGAPEGRWVFFDITSASGWDIRSEGELEEIWHHIYVYKIREELRRKRAGSKK